VSALTFVTSKQNAELYDTMVFWEAGERALILRHCAHHDGTDKIKVIDILQKLSMKQKYLEYQ